MHHRVFEARERLHSKRPVSNVTLHRRTRKLQSARVAIRGRTGDFPGILSRHLGTCGRVHRVRAIRGPAFSDHGFHSSGGPCGRPSSLSPTTLRFARFPGHRRRKEAARGVTLLDHMHSQTFRRENLLPVLRKPSVSLLGPPVYTEVHERPCRVASFGCDP